MKLYRDNVQLVTLRANYIPYPPPPKKGRKLPVSFSPYNPAFSRRLHNFRSYYCNLGKALRAHFANISYVVSRLTKRCTKCARVPKFMYIPTDDGANKRPCARLFFPRAARATTVGKVERVHSQRGEKVVARNRDSVTESVALRERYL